MIGLVINEQGARHVADLVATDAHVRTGGLAPNSTSYTATVLDNITPEMRVHHEEIVGPAVAVIITEDTRRGLGLASRPHTDVVHVGNQTIDDEAQALFGGVKSTGYGRFGGRWGVNAFTGTRWMTMADQHDHFPF